MEALRQKNLSLATNSVSFAVVLLCFYSPNERPIDFVDDDQSEGPKESTIQTKGFVVLYYTTGWYISIWKC
jgi:hypothetical protein